MYCTYIYVFELWYCMCCMHVHLHVKCCTTPSGAYTNPNNAFLTTPASSPTTTPQDNSTTTPQDHSTTTPQDHSTTTPEDNSTTTPQDNSTTTPQDHSTTTPQDNSTTTPQDNSTTTPQDNSTLDNSVSVYFVYCSCSLHAAGVGWNPTKKEVQDYVNRNHIEAYNFWVGDADKSIEAWWSRLLSWWGVRKQVQKSKPAQKAKKAKKAENADKKQPKVRKNGMLNDTVTSLSPYSSAKL